MTLMGAGAGAGSGSGLTGRWRLLQWRAVDESGATLGYPFGEAAAGAVVYSPGGWMYGQLSAEPRPSMSTSDPVGGPEHERAAAYSTYVAYWGRYEIEDDRIVHHVEQSLFPAWSGGAQVRYFTLSDDVLVLRTPAVELRGNLVVNELRWQREEGW
jgi:hypothetical protein